MNDNNEVLASLIYWHSLGQRDSTEKKVSRKGSKHIWVDSVFDGDSKYVKKSIGCHARFWKSSLFFQRSFTKSTSKLQPRKVFASEKMPLHVGCRTPKTAGLYLVPSKSYSQNSHTHGLFGWTIDHGTLSHHCLVNLLLLFVFITICSNVN